MITGVYEIKKILSNELKELITIILQFDCEKRPNINEIMKHPWIAKMKK
jgi:hypothetical protein